MRKGGDKMGQYFIIVNIDKKEWFKTKLVKLWEICVNRDIGVLAYLLATNNTDGTPLMWSEEENGEYVIKVAKTKYFGRWCGDRIVVLGDYANEATNYRIDHEEYPDWNDILDSAEWKNITQELFMEYEKFINSPKSFEYVEFERFKIPKLKFVNNNSNSKG